MSAGELDHSSYDSRETPLATVAVQLGPESDCNVSVQPIINCSHLQDAFDGGGTRAPAKELAFETRGGRGMHFDWSLAHATQLPPRATVPQYAVAGPCETRGWRSGQRYAVSIRRLVNGVPCETCADRSRPSCAMEWRSHGTRAPVNGAPHVKHVTRGRARGVPCKTPWPRQWCAFSAFAAAFAALLCSRWGGVSTRSNYNDIGYVDSSA